MAAVVRQAVFALFCRLERDRRGVTALEFAIVVPCLLLVLLGITKFGLAINNYEMLTGGTQAAARQFALSRGSSTPSSTATTALYNGTPNLTQANITVTLKVNGSTCTGDTACQTALTSAEGKPATVTATYPCDLSIYGYDFAPNCTLTSQMTESIE